MVVFVGIIRRSLPRVCRDAFLLSVNFVGIGRDQLQSEFSFDGVDEDSRNVASFVSWIGLDRRISFGRSGFGRLDLMLRIEPTHIVGASWS